MEDNKKKKEKITHLGYEVVTYNNEVLKSKQMLARDGFSFFLVYKHKGILSFNDSLKTTNVFIFPS